MSKPIRFGEFFRAVRGQRTQMEFCKILGVSQSVVSKIETNLREPSAQEFVLSVALAYDDRSNSAHSVILESARHRMRKWL